jgi:DNA-binding LytR/AlgR family response regulator
MTSSKNFKIILIEDEPLAAERLRDLVLAYPNGSPEIIDFSESIEEAVEAINKEQPDLLLCDIQLADGLSFNIWSQVEVRCPVIFTTAYEEYALRAFKLNSIDYLLKPINPEELYSALDKFLTSRTTSSSQAITPELIAQVAAAIRQPTYRDRYMSQVNDKLTPIAVSQINYFQSAEKITWAINQAGRRFPLDPTLAEIEGEVDPRQFFRINRAFIVKNSAVKQLVAYSNSRYSVVLEGYKDKEPVIVARDRVGKFKEWLSR